ncbi:MAG: endonuclease MutS2 [Lachnospiraceae bacterium]|nr:endonuclease MutS2 [Lachnospiraceae bacterium]
MNEKALRILEYPKVIAKLTEFADSAPGKGLCESLVPMDDLSAIVSAQNETEDATSYIIRLGKISFGQNRDLSFSLNALSLGSSLSAAELLHLAAAAECAGKVHKYGAKEHETDEDNTLTPYFEGLIPLPDVAKEIRRCLISEEEVADDASAELSKIRRQKLSCNDKMHEVLSQMVNSFRTYLQDAVITTRNNRYCLPVKAEYKNSVPGMVHDRSKAGSTFFIEPSQVVEYNNRLQELESLEKEEIEKILATLSALAGEHIEEFASNAKILTRLDFLFAKGKLALSMKAGKPEYVSERIIELHKARHPFIDPAKVVPIDIKFGEDVNLMIITGPNTGGKTVSLKTTGLLCAMGQAGLHIPASTLSKLCVFRDIFADIGDEQSIEQSLSTFSAHMTNIISILKKADRHCLCLFDELCAGTDPAEGAALAIAILKNLQQKDALTLATTHYSELKIFALSAPGTLNASCEFDVETLTPTYHLLLGIPGKSNAFAISSKLGLPGEIIEEAKKEVTENQISFEDLLSDLDHSRKEIEAKEQAMEEDRERIEVLRLELEEKNAELARKRENVLRKANEEARDILQDAKDTADEAIRSYHKGGDIRTMEKTRANLREKIKDRSKNLSEKQTPVQTSKSLTAEEIKKGDYLEILSMKMKGTVQSLPDAKGNMMILCGAMQVRANIKDVRRSEAPVDLDKTSSKSGKKGNYSGKFSKAMNISPEINLLGQTADEAIANLDKYLDDAYLSHLHSVRVVHGKGTGVLRDAVARHLKKLSYVKDFHLGEYGEGDAGVTIVEFK